MIRLGVSVFVLWAFACTLAPAQQEFADIPAAFSKVAQVERVFIFAKKDGIGPASLTELRAGVSDIWVTYKEIYGLDGATWTFGVDGGTFPKRPSQNVGLLLFTDQKEYDDWLGTPGTGAVNIHSGRYTNVIGFPLEEKKVGKTRWNILWHEFSHVFLWHYLYFGGPTWLNEGLAEYFGYANKRIQPMEVPSFKEMIERLRKAKEDGTASKVSDLLLYPQNKFGRQQYDEAWVLCHLLLTEAKAQFNELLAAIQEQEKFAWDNEDGIRADGCKLLKQLLEASFGGPDRLQEAWTYHRDALLKSPTIVAKLARGPKSLRDRPVFFEATGGLRVSVVKDSTGAEYEVGRATCTVKCGAALDGNIQVVAAWGAGRGRWTKDVLVGQRASGEIGEVLKLHEVEVPISGDSSTRRMLVIWDVKGGGKYAAGWTYGGAK